jgi:dTMP kinase
MGYFVSFCGLDGCGKTTQAHLLKRYIEETYNKPCHIAPNFKPTHNTDKLRQISANITGNPYTDFTPDIMSMSLVADLWNNFHDHIVPNLENNEIVITERFTESLLAYGPIFGSTEQLLRKIVDIFPVPDLYIFIDLDANVAHERVVFRSKINGIALTPKENLQVMKKAASAYKCFIKDTKKAIIVEPHNLDVSQVSDVIIDRFEEVKNSFLFGGH